MVETNSDKQSDDPEMDELLDRLRVILPGVQVLFAFLLTVPFTQRFADITTPLQRDVYFVTLMCAAVSTILLIAPAAHHSIQARHRVGPQSMKTATRLTIAGTLFLGMAVTGVIFVVTDVLFGTVAAAAAAIVVGGLLAWLWYGLPLYHRYRS